MDDDVQVDEPSESAPYDSPVVEATNARPGPSAIRDWAAFNRIVDGAHDEARAVAALRGVPLLSDAELKQIVDRHLAQEQARPAWNPAAVAPAVSYSAPDRTANPPAARGLRAAGAEQVADDQSEGDGPADRPADDSGPFSSDRVAAGPSGATPNAGGKFLRADLRSDGARLPGVQQAAWSGAPLAANRGGGDGSSAAATGPAGAGFAPTAFTPPAGGAPSGLLVRAADQSGGGPQPATSAKGGLSGVLDRLSKTFGGAPTADPRSNLAATTPASAGAPSPYRAVVKVGEGDLQTIGVSPHMEALRKPALDIMKAAELHRQTPEQTWNLVTSAYLESTFGTRSGKGGHKSLFQFSDDDWKQYGKGLDINNTFDQVTARIAKIEAEKARFFKNHQRYPTFFELNLMHQQGDYGGPALLFAKPGVLAVDALVGSGMKRRWAVDHIRQNLPPGSGFNAETVTAAQFVDVWRSVWRAKQKEAEEAIGMWPGRDAYAPRNSHWLD